MQLADLGPTFSGVAFLMGKMYVIFIYERKIGHNVVN